MGGGSWDTDVHTAAAAYRRATATPTFGHTAAVYSGKVAAGVSASLDPKGVMLRESRDSADHPESLPIAVALDVTGSMADIPPKVVESLPKLFETLLKDGRVTDPQLMFSAIGDAYSDAAPLQIGQFESDNRSEEQLREFYLEGGGGAGRTESYELYAWFMANRTALDSVEKRGHKGYMFIIGDEMPYPRLENRTTQKVVDAALGHSVTTTEIFDALKEKFEVFYVIPTHTTNYGDATIMNTWRDLVGQNIIQLDNVDDLCEKIATQVAQGEEAWAASHKVAVTA